MSANGRGDGGALRPIDVLVNAAAQQHVAPIEEFPPEIFDSIVATNLGAAFHATPAGLPHHAGARLGPDRQPGLGARPGGLARQVGLCRGQARHGRPDQGDGARDRRLRHHLQRDLPGLHRHRIDHAAGRGHRAARSIGIEEAARILLDKQPSGQWVPVESLGALVVFLCSDAAAQMTGATLPIEGGWTAQ